MITYTFAELPLYFDGALLDCMFSGAADIEDSSAGPCVTEIRLPSSRGEIVLLRHVHRGTMLWTGIEQALLMTRLEMIDEELADWRPMGDPHAEFRMQQREVL